MKTSFVWFLLLQNYTHQPVVIPYPYRTFAECEEVGKGVTKKSPVSFQNFQCVPSPPKDTP